MMLKKVIVLGGGSAGFLAAMALKTRLPQLQVTVIRSREIGIIGVGEGSTVALTDFLHQYIRVGNKKFFEVAQPTWKLGLRFVQWGQRPWFHYAFSRLQLDGKLPGLRKVKAFYCEQEMAYEDSYSAFMSHDRIFERRPNGTPALHTALAYHFENENFVRFVEGYATSLGVNVLEDTVNAVQQDEAGISALRLASERVETADLYIDCSGFFSVMLGKTLGTPFISYDDTLFCSRAVVGGWERTDEPIKPYTTCQTMSSGWCWQIEHEKRINRGYVYSPAFISDDQAEQEFRAGNPRLGPTRIVKFVSGRYQNCWVKNVVAIGNAAGFVEPLEATALGGIAVQSRTLAETLSECDGRVTPTAQNHYNTFHNRNWDTIRDFLAIHYRYNSYLDTPFWRHCREKTPLRAAEPIVHTYAENGPTFVFGDTLLQPGDQFGMIGYIALLLGQRVACPSYQPSESESQAWITARQKHKSAALAALTIKQTFEAIRSPQWEWRNP